MDNLILNSYSKISNLNVSRETCNELESLISMIQEKNQKINIISKKMYEKEAIRERHIIDSAQIIDFVDLNYNTTSDLGTGGGMPGLIVAIVMKKIKNDLKVNLYEKSYHKCAFLREVSKKLNLNTQIKVWDSTSEMRYLVLPMRPVGTEHLSENELEGLVTRNSMIGTGLPETPK